MRVAIVHPFPVGAGAEEQGSKVIVRDRAVGSLLRERGHDVLGLRTTRGEHESAPSVDEFMEWTYLPVDRESVALPGLQVGSSRLVEVLAEWSPDLVVVKGAGTDLGNRIFASHDGPFATIIGGRYRDSTVTRAELAFSENVLQERYLQRRMGRRRVVRMPKLASGVFHPPDEKGDKSIDAIIVSGFTKHKNHDLLLPLLDADISVVFVGDGPLRRQYEERVEGCNARVTFTGSVEADRVAQLLRASRVLLHPSVSEGFPRAVVEAMATGVPSVCLRGVVGEPLRHNRDAIVVPSGDLVGAALDLLGDARRAAELGAAARLTYESHFSLEAVGRAVDSALGVLDGDLVGFAAHGRRRRAVTGWRAGAVGAPRRSASRVRRLFGKSRGV